MTNEQLAILLTGIQSELSYAIGESRRLFDRPRELQRVHAPADLFCLGLGCTNPEHYTEVLSFPYIPELAPFETVFDDLEDRIVALKGS